MPEFNSPLGKKPFAPSNLKNIEIPDESNAAHTEVRNYQFSSGSMDDFQERLQSAPSNIKNDIEIEREIMAAKEERRTGRQRLSPAATHRIEMLMGMTRSTKEVEINGATYVLQSLKSKELREALTAVSPFDGTIELPFETRKQLLARSLTHIAGVEFNQFLGSDQLKDKLDFIEEVDHALLTRLYDEYGILAKESQSKYAIKTDEDVKEVAEDLKKS